MSRIVAFVTAAVLLAGCGDDDDDDAHPGDGDADADGDGDGDGDGDARWTIEAVDMDDAANQTSLAVSASGQVGIAYYTVSHTEGADCPQGDPPGPRFHWALRFASGTPGAMQVEQVASPFFVTRARGVSLAYDGEVPRLAAPGGDIDPTRPEYCGLNDLHLWSRQGAGAWTSELVVAGSGEAPSDSCVAPSLADFGWVVGFDPALAIDAAGQQAVAWRDLHAGGTLQHKDIDAADLEGALRSPGGDWVPEMLGCAAGAGTYTTLAWEAGGDLLAAWGNEDSAAGGEGVWLARRGVPAWDTFLLYGGEVRPRVSMAIAPDGTVGVVWQQERALWYASLAPGRPLSEAVSERASPVTITSGGHASLAYTADGTPVVSHYRCNQTGADDLCSAAEDGPVWSWRVDGAWQIEDIEPELDEWLCGDTTQIGVRPDGTIVVAYTCQVRHEDGSFAFHLRMASRPRL